MIKTTTAGEPGVDYPILAAVPATGFSCEEREDGLYGDTEAGCQARLLRG